jgi:hypothetical protein
MQEVIKLHDELVYMGAITQDTFDLIKKAKSLTAIKKLIEIHEILSLNACVIDKFRDSQLTFDEVWLDESTLRFLNRLRCELMVYHHSDFISRPELEIYNRNFCRFLNIILLRLKNGFDFDLPDFVTASIQGQCHT